MRRPRPFLLLLLVASFLLAASIAPRTFSSSLAVVEATALVDDSAEAVPEDSATLDEASADPEQGAIATQDDGADAAFSADQSAAASPTNGDVSPAAPAQAPEPLNLSLLVGPTPAPTPAPARDFFLTPGTTGVANPVLAIALREVTSIYVHTPPGLLPGEPVRVVYAFHGMGGSGKDFSQPLLATADEQRWLVVAPTFNYGDWTSPSVIGAEDPSLIAWLNNYLDELPSLVGRPTQSTVLLVGHSRGAQLALRFTEFHPERVKAVYAMSAGTYTLPVATDGSGKSLLFPYGLGDLKGYVGQAFDPKRFRGVRVWVGVGANDANPADVPRAWDAYIGKQRVERAQRFTEALRSTGTRVDLTLFQDAGHGLTSQMWSAMCESLASTGGLVAGNSQGS